jgi:hypothetical protein
MPPTDLADASAISRCGSGTPISALSRTRLIMQTRRFIVLLMLVLSACGENPQKGEKGDQGPAGPEGAPGPVGAAGMSGTVIRFVEIECRQICFLACKENERILSSYAINPGGAFTFDADHRKATFRPQLQGAPVKVVLACAEK